MSPIQQMLLGVGAVATKTYVDDVFSTYLWTGNSSTRTIATGLDMSGEGGMVAIKSRSHSQPWVIGGTGLGDNHCLAFDTTQGKDNQVQKFKSLTSTGFEIGNDHEVNSSSDSKTYGGFSFRKAPGFFTICEWTGNDTNRQISHDLGSVPGCIIVKRTDASGDWRVYHRSLGAENVVFLNTTDASGASSTSWNDLAPTSSVFNIGTNGDVNAGSGTFVAYVFAGGESGAATARSIDLDGSGDYLSTSSSSSDFTMGTGDFTIECWAKPDANSSDQPLFQISDTSGGFKSAAYTNTLTVWHRPGGNWVFCANGSEQEISGYKPPIGVWYHMALVRNSGTTALYVNGTKINSATDSTNYNGTYFVIGGYYSTAYVFNGLISNFRVVKGTAVYTSAFNPPTAPLTNITNTKLLCCNNSSTTGSTVSPVTINAYGNTTASSDSPFDDPAGFKFGESGSENVIKCGSFVGNHTNLPEIYLGFEPQFLLWKNADQSQDWFMVDSMRGVVTGGNAARLRPNQNYTENSSQNPFEFTPTGFNCTNTDNNTNGVGENTIFLAIRRPDGYVGKPPELGTGVFAMDSAASDEATIPNFDSGFPVDFAISRKPATADSWMVGNRLLGTKFLYTENNDAEATESDLVWDSNVGIYKDWPTSMMGWMWKRHAGFDVVTAKGGQNKRIAHSLNKIPEMYWVKNRDATENWTVYHKGLNGGTNPENRYIVLNTTGGESGSDTSAWNSFVPTSTHISFGTMDTTGGNSSHDYLVMLFASVDGISKLGYYDGSSSDVTVTTGFQPRFVMIKKSNGNGGWFVADTIRGWTASSTNTIKLNANAAQAGNSSFSGPISTGFTVSGGQSNWNASGNKYIYYAHA